MSNNQPAPQGQTVEVTPEIALRILDAATDPKNGGKLTRSDYANSEAALQVLGKFVDDHSPKKEQPAPHKGKKELAKEAAAAEKAKVPEPVAEVVPLPAAPAGKKK